MSKLLNLDSSPNRQSNRKLFFELQSESRISNFILIIIITVVSYKINIFLFTLKQSLPISSCLIIFFNLPGVNKYQNAALVSNSARTLQERIDGS